MKIGYILLIYCLILCGNLIAQTNVQGTISGIWAISESPYIVVGDIKLPTDSTLIIKPGVEIRFDGHFKFIINGLLMALGNSDSMIVFTRNQPLEMYNWWGLRFIDADSNCILKHCIIEYARTEYSDSDGGGIYCLDSSPLISNCIIRKNHAYGYGGGIYCEDSSPVIQNNTIANNNSGLAGSIFDAMAGCGGGICCKNSSPLISNNIIIKNKSGFDGNILGGDGGGISILDDSSPIITNNIIKENRAIDVAGVGGGIYSNGINVQVINNVIYNNSSSVGGGGIEGNSSTILKNSIFWRNKIVNPYIGEIPDQISGSVSISYSNIEGGYEGEGNIDADPLFVDAAGGDFHLQSNSPCIDAGDPNVIFNDQDGTRNDMGYAGGSGIVLSHTEYLFHGGSPFEQIPATDLKFFNCRENDFLITNLILADTVNFFIQGNLQFSIPSVNKVTIPVIFYPQGIGTFETTLEIYSPEFYGGNFVTIKLIGISSGNGIEGIVTGNLIKANSPYLVLGDIIVPNDSSLKIEPGVHLLFGGPFGITVNGLLQAEGTEIDSIIFDRFHPSEKFNWGGIRFVDADSNSIISYCIISHAQHDGLGGAIYTENCKFIIRNNKIVHNRAEYGGGIYCFGWYPRYKGNGPSVIENIICNNIAKNGGGISINYFYSDISSEIKKNIIEYNTADDRGGGIFCFRAFPIIQNNSIRNNTAYIGGGIHCQYESLPIVVENLVEMNNAKWGGGIEIDRATAEIRNNLIRNNKALGESGSGGGGIDCEHNSSPIIENNIIVRNESVDGGGIQCWDSSSPNITNNTICFNIALRGGGIVAGDNCFPNVMNTIFWENNAQEGSEIALVNSTITISYSDIQKGWTGVGNIDADPLFNCVSNDNFHLILGSPCIDAGNPDSKYNDPDGSRNDMGAYGGPKSNVWTGIKKQDKQFLLNEFSVCQNYPNPFNNSTIIRYSIPRSSLVTLEIYNVRGQKIKTLLYRQQEAGTYEIVWEGSALPSGIYFYRIKACGSSQMRKCLLVK
ncbi:MAG: right-handed parallel beta-helix repeat-containing protein [Candidatus Hodarchaeota archaeon]